MLGGKKDIEDFVFSYKYNLTCKALEEAQAAMRYSWPDRWIQDLVIIRIVPGLRNQHYVEYEYMVAFQHRLQGCERRDRGELGICASFTYAHG